MSLFSVLSLAIAVSLDGLGAGLACGLKRVRVPFFCIILMGLAAGGAVLISMFIGVWLGSFIPSRLAELAGGLTLVLLGTFMLWQAGKGKERGGLLGLRQDPSLADSDHSGSLSGQEAAVLGIALALDGFSAGFGAALAGFSPGLTGLAVVMANIAFVSIGLKLGQMVSGLALKNILLLPGLIILLLGAMKLAMW